MGEGDQKSVMTVYEVIKLELILIVWTIFRQG